MDLQRISSTITAAIAALEAAGQGEHAEVLRVQGPELMRAARGHHCLTCEYHPTNHDDRANHA
ncbi:MAG TPA: hypothetical protein DCS97_07050 [Planctomycetes bacterium]|nr:hypothetical protein [Planctomycetota bacterium]